MTLVKASSDDVYLDGLDDTSRARNGFELKLVQPLDRLAATLFDRRHLEAHAVFLVVDGHVGAGQIGVEEPGALQVPILISQPHHT